MGAGSFEEDEEESEPEIVASLRAEIVQQAELETQKAKTGDLWRLNCEQLAEMDGRLVEKDEEISRLKDEVARLRRSSPSDNSEGASVESGGAPVPSRVRRGKAPPVDPFTGEDPECRLMIGFRHLEEPQVDRGRLTHPAGRPSERPVPPRVEPHCLLLGQNITYSPFLCK